MAKALVTFVVGDNYFIPWNKYLRIGWVEWCKKNSYELIVFDEVLDESPRGVSRSLAWQKLLVMSSSQLDRFDQVLWLDSDVMICPNAPDPLKDAPIDLVAMSRDGGSPLSGDPDWFCRCWSAVLENSLKIKVPSHKEGLFSYLDLWGFNSMEIPLWNTGVIGFSPKYHSELFEYIYRTWEDGGKGALFEMIPLNLELNKRSLIFELDKRFNVLFGVHLAVWRLTPENVQIMHQLTSEDMSKEDFSYLLAQKSFFLHFAGAHKSMQSLLRTNFFLKKTNLS